jgi:hypothetical protein
LQIIAPARSLQEAELLFISGVSLVLLEFQPQLFTHCTKERKEPGRPGRVALTSLEEVARTVECAHGYEGKAYLCADAEASSGRAIQSVMDTVIGACEQVEIDGIMTANPCLVIGLREARVPKDVMIGPEELVLNRETVLFWKDLGVKKIVLPSYLSVNDVESLVKDMKEVDFCAAVFRGRASPDESVSGNPAERPVPSRSGADSIEALFCSLCNIPRLAKAGVASVSVEIHGGPIDAKIGLVTAVRTLVDMLASGMGDEDVAAAAREIMECEKLHTSGYLCLACAEREARQSL